MRPAGPPPPMSNVPRSSVNVGRSGPPPGAPPPSAYARPTSASASGFGAPPTPTSGGRSFPSTPSSLLSSSTSPPTPSFTPTHSLVSHAASDASSRSRTSAVNYGTNSSFQFNSAPPPSSPPPPKPNTTPSHTNGNGLHSPHSTNRAGPSAYSNNSPVIGAQRSMTHSGMSTTPNGTRPPPPPSSSIAPAPSSPIPPPPSIPPPPPSNGIPPPPSFMPPSTPTASHRSTPPPPATSPPSNAVGAGNRPPFERAVSLPSMSAPTHSSRNPHPLLSTDSDPPSPALSASATPKSSNAAPPSSFSNNSTPPLPSGAPPPPPKTLFAMMQQKDSKLDCTVEGCYSRAEIGGCCILHYYSSSAMNKGQIEEKAAAANQTAMETERTRLCEELVATEKTYGDGLRSVVKGMILRLNKYEELSMFAKPLMDKEEMSICFLNLEHIFELQQQLYQEMKTLRNSNQLLGPQLGALLSKVAPVLIMYTTYVDGFGESQKKLKELREERPQLDAFFRHCEACEGQRVADYMISPVQRVPRYALLLRAIEKNTSPNDESLSGIRDALQAIESVAASINDSFKEKERRQKVVVLQEHIEGLTEPLITPHRTFIRDGPLEKRYNNSSFKLSETKTYHFILFSDLLLYTTIPNARGYCKLKYTLPLGDMELVNIVDSEKQQNAFEIKSTSVKSFVVMAPTAIEKQAWLQAINESRDTVLKGAASIKSKPLSSMGIAPWSKTSGMAGGGAPPASTPTSSTSNPPHNFPQGPMTPGKHYGTLPLPKQRVPPPPQS